MRSERRNFQGAAGDSVSNTAQPTKGKTKMFYSKWIGYEFASDIEIDGYPCSGYLEEIFEDIVNGKSKHRSLYKVEIRPLYGKPFHKNFTCKEFREHFVRKTVLP